MTGNWKKLKTKLFQFQRNEQIQKENFILNQLLPFAMTNNRRILYLVNRKALKKQIEDDIAVINYSYLRHGLGDARYFITVMTYQHLEQDIKKRTLISCIL